MNGCLDDYKAVSHRTRWIGIIGSAVMLGSAALELWGLHITVSWAEGPFHRDLVEAVMKQEGLLMLVGMSFAVRSVVLLASAPGRYFWSAFTWLLSFAAVIFYLWSNGLPYSPVTVCQPSGPRFELYDMTRSDWVVLAGVGFILLSVFRILVTAAWAVSLRRYK